jgi:glycosyltransferase involved in cell wall biosynthesis
MKVALMHDFLLQEGGAEKVLKAMYEVFPGDVHTLLKKGCWPFEKIIDSSLKVIPFAEHFYQYLLPLIPRAVEGFDLRGYDVVLSSSHAFIKNCLTTHEQLHICYCHSPMRSIWDLYHEHLEYVSGVKRVAFKHISHNLRLWDSVSSSRIDHFVANSQYVAKRVKRTYGRTVDSVIYPPVNLDEFSVDQAPDSYYICISRLVPYKKVELVVEAFSHMSDKKLIVIGDGPLYRNMKRKVHKNIEILGFQERSVCIQLLSKAKAFIHLGIEDFGIAMVEALASGVPLIALKKGGATEIMQDPAQGEWVEEQTVRNLIESVEKFEKKEFDRRWIRTSVERFDSKRFKKEFSQFVSQKNEAFSYSKIH